MARSKASKPESTDKTVSRTIGAGAGAMGGAAAGAAVGTAIAPGVGTAIGAVVGGLAGGVGGHQVSALIDPDEEVKHWEGEYANRPYYTEDIGFDEVRPAYRYGVEAANKYPDKSFAEVEGRLGRNWPKSRGESHLTWSKARGAIQDAFDRTIQLHEERLRVEKEQVEAGAVELRKETVTERKQIDVPVEREEVVITRRPATGRAKEGAFEAQAEEVRIPVKEERVKVSKEVVPTEEVTVGRRKVRGTEHVEGTVRREELRTEGKGGARVRDERAPRK